MLTITSCTYDIDIALSRIKLCFHVEIEHSTRMSHDRSIAYPHQVTEFEHPGMA